MTPDGSPCDRSLTATSRLQKELVTHPAVEAFDKPVSRMGFPGAISCYSILCSAYHLRIAFEVSSVPLVRKTIHRIVF